MSLKKQQSLLGTFNRHMTFTKAINNSSTLSSLRIRLTNIKLDYASFCENQAAVEESCGPDTIDGQFTLRGQVEEFYYFTVSEISEAIKYREENSQQQGSNSTNSTRSTHDVKLPRIELTAFSGRYEDWTSFNDLYRSLIHNNASLSNVQKLHYLKANVKGDADILLKSISITEANYEPAWKRLTDRYEHKRYIVDSHLKILLNQPAVKVENHVAIKSLIDKSSEIVRALQVQGQPVDQWDAFLVHIVVSKLDPETHKQWELTLRKDELPTFAELETFLENRWQSLELIHKSSSITYNNSGQNQNKYPAFKSHRAFVNTSSYQQESHSHNIKCNYCSKEGHTVTACPEYTSLSYVNKIEFVKNKRLCFNCLRSGHSLSDCKSKVSCHQCGKRHHTSIHHLDRSYNTTSSSIADNYSQKSTIASRLVTNASSNHRTRTLLATAIIYVRTSTGNQLTVRALIDGGSEDTLIQESLARKLGLFMKPELIPITGVGDVVVQNQTNLVKVEIKSRTDPSFCMEVEAFTMKTVTGILPSIPVEKKTWSHFQGIKLADDHFDSPAPIGMLLGMEVYEAIIMEGLIPKKDNSPTAMNSRLGWLLFGKVQTITPVPKNINCHHVIRSEETLESAMRAFWESEEVPAVRKLTIKEQQAENIFKQNVTRNRDGRYVVSLPFDPSHQNSMLGNSRTAAMHCLYSMEKRFKSNQNLRERYNEYIKNLIHSEHMELVPRDRLNLAESESFYLPHHPVLKESSLTTKLRVVFNASRKSTSGISLNDKLLIGPKTQEDLFSIMIRWRKHKIVFIADVEKMYRQVKITPNDRDYQRLLWRFSPKDPISEYRITTVIDGTASASYLATRALRQLAEDYTHQYPEAAEIVKSDFYVDDLTSGSHDTQSAIKIQDDLINLMKHGGFNLRKWFSNCYSLMNNVPKQHRHDPEALVELINEGVKTLGIYWNQKEDCFVFKVASSNPSKTITKREVLSEIAKLFDPIGWLSPTTIKAKIFLQGLWTLKTLDWDDCIPEEKYQEWNSYRSELSSLESIKIDRWIGTTSIVNIQLHGFSDASNLAYAAVVYSRTIMSDGTIMVNQISAKTKVAPLKTITIPKLELCGCVILSRLMDNIKRSFKFENVKIHLYSDSTVALGWITSHPNHWNIFVANRVNEIQEISNSSPWHYVNTDENPADCASRGVDPSKLRDHPLWWQGPSWLSKSEDQWPKHPQVFTTEMEKRKVIKVFHIKSDNGINSHMQKYLEEHSDLSTLQRRTAYILRCLPGKNSIKSNNEIPTAREYQKALVCWIKYAQVQSFAEDMACCRESVEMPKKSKLKSLNPYLDEDGIIRVGGRLSKSKLPFKAKHPIILPKGHHVTKLIIKQAHQLTLHGGPSLMSAFLSNYWIFGKADQIKRVIKSCLTCFPFTCKPQSQIMADLPEPRVTPQKPFRHTAVDFAGPYQTKSFIGRSRGKFANVNTKSYISVFVCLSTKAVHIELVSDYTSVAFIEAFKRFVGIRGQCSDLYSDCGTNFIGADHIMKRQMKMLHDDEGVQLYLSQDHTEWHFNPPASPHFGGLHEAGVKSIKYHLKRLIGDSVLTFEEMTTTLYQIAACLNSRPLCQISDDINDISYLTPGHFLLGEAPITVPEKSLLNTKNNRLSRWQLSQKLYQQFWKYWSSDYLSKLQQRTKWTSESKNIRVGQMVLYRADNLPPTKWPIAKVINVHPGPDGKVRVATIQTQNSIFKRPIVKLSILPNEH